MLLCHTGRISLENLKKVANEFGDTISGEDKEVAHLETDIDRGEGRGAGHIDESYVST